MTKSTPAIFFACLLAACSGSPEKEQQVAAVPKDSIVAVKMAPMAEREYYSPVLKQYNAYLKGLDTQQLHNIYLAVQEFKNLCKEQPVEIVDTAFSLFDDFHRRIVDAAQQDTTDLTPLIMYEEDEKTRKGVTEKLLALEARFKANGIAIEAEEGTPYLAKDMSFTVAQFGDLVSPAMKEYLVRMSEDQKSGFQNDAGLVISPTELSDRVVWWEKFSKANPVFVYAEAASDNYRYFLTFLLIGMDNSPVEENGALSEDFKAAYLHVQEQYSGTDAERYITPYLKAYVDKNEARAKQILQDYEKRKIILYSR